MVDGVPPHPHSWFVRGSSPSVSAGERKPGSPPPRLFNHVCLVPKGDASSHTPNGADHTQSVLPGRGISGHGKQRS